MDERHHDRIVVRGHPMMLVDLVTRFDARSMAAASSRFILESEGWSRAHTRETIREDALCLVRAGRQSQSMEHQDQALGPNSSDKPFRTGESAR